MCTFTIKIEIFYSLMYKLYKCYFQITSIQRNLSTIILMVIICRLVKMCIFALKVMIQESLVQINQISNQIGLSIQSQNQSLSQSQPQSQSKSKISTSTPNLKHNLNPNPNPNQTLTAIQPQPKFRRIH
ncbi:hypothetical protein FGO68_gene6856 [Halteria grandinella]|uniref:Uncharacterized protein n=1 Tax=Halteria grandinella TaxID=5974 RepID=A0A8J8NC26_HALGN|nr:hypothetical protein FGO68_gene6856 [Halteria grandinella]